MASLEEIVKQLSNPAPAYEDPDDDAGDGTAAQLSSNNFEEAEDASLTDYRQRSTLRRRAAAYLEVDQRYQGKKTSRKDLYDFGDDEDDEGVGDLDKQESDEATFDFEHDEKSDDDSSAAEGDDDMEEEMEDDQPEDDESNSEEEDEQESIEDDDDVASDKSITSEESDDEEVNIQGSDKDQKEKAEAVVEQIDQWDRLMEARIKLQKVLSLVHKIPPGVPPEDSITKQGALSTLDELGCTFCGLLSGSKTSPSKKRKADSDLEKTANECFTSYQSFRNDTLSFWDDKTRLASKKFKSFNSFNTSVLKQVEQILSDRDRLVRRTRVSRDADAMEMKPEEIFDDNDFYQRLLRQLIERKAGEADTSESTQSQWLEIQKLRGTKKKKDVDTRASKGRKLRYNIHSKMVNFMAPRDDSTWSEEAKNELFKNLFKMPTAGES